MFPTTACGDGGEAIPPNNGMADKRFCLRKMVLEQPTIQALLSSSTATDAEHMSLYMCKVHAGHEEAVMQALSNYFCSNHHLKSLELTLLFGSDGGNAATSSAVLQPPLSDHASTLLASASTHTKSLRQLKLFLYGPGGSVFEDACRGMVSSNIHLERLTVTLPGAPYVASQICQILTNNSFVTHMRELDFSNMTMGDAAFGALTEAVCVPSNLSFSLEVLLLSRNNLHGHAALTNLTKLLHQLVNLRFLDVCGNAGLFRFDTNNTHLAIGGGADQDEELLVLPAAPEQHHPQHQSSRDFMRALARHSSLVTLLIRACSMKGAEAILMFDALTENTTLQHVDLDFNLIEITGALHLIQTLPQMKSLRILEMDDMELQTTTQDNEENNNNNHNELSNNDFLLIEPENRAPSSLGMLKVQSWGDLERQALMEAMQQNFSLCDLVLDRRLSANHGIMQQGMNLVFGANRLLARLEQAAAGLQQDKKWCCAAANSNQIMLQQLCLQKVCPRIQESRRRAMAIYYILQRKEW